MSGLSFSIGGVKQEMHVASFSGLSFVVCKETRETDKATPRENFAMKMEIEILFTLTCATGITRA